MIGIDTNVLVRYIVQDDARQAALANQFIETTLSDDEPGWIASVVLCEFGARSTTIATASISATR